MVPQPVALDPITTNLAYPAERWVRLDISVLFEEPTDPELARTIHQDILAYMRTVSLQQIEGARGFQHLRADLTERAELRSDGKVSELLFRTFVIE
jgi:flagellar FliL protein